MTATTEYVLQSHLQAAGTGIDAIMGDYTNDSILVTQDATYRGLTEIRRFFSALFGGLPEKFFDGAKIERQEIVGELAYILWRAEPWVPFATDTFLVRDGKILVQTVTARLAQG